MALSLDLRTRVVEAYENGEGSIRELASRFKVSAKSISNWLALKRTTGSLKAHSAGMRHSALNGSGEALLKALVRERPAASLEMLVVLYNHRRGEDWPPATVASMRRSLERLQLTERRREPTEEIEDFG